MPSKAAPLASEALSPEPVRRSASPMPAVSFMLLQNLSANIYALHSGVLLA